MTKLDKRVQRTQYQLRSALLALIVEHGYEQLSVQDILDRAGVGRATFYAHYRSKEDLLVRSMDILRLHLVAETAAKKKSKRTPLGFTLAFFRHVDSHRQLWRAIVGRESGFIVDRQMRRLLLDLVRLDTSRSAALGRSNKIPELAAHFLVGALMSVMVWWLDYNIRLTPLEVDRVFREMSLPTLKALLP
ncbi:transcriptional regulator, TetR family [Candidatus Koribacter versatilis Ellin345]|uniref:Transcriptional regulator, TetR family n=1 Tax=Koribacter versatilis (strain Ellin345) TaxID=204669 RepID=Q1IVT0_KORVE|nr:TetR/AcrR family transcriptional regulator [Candidatus Koribacter versatilis]ABF39020.1 transcriptional regulator, TetR family [Candidatus Koribacter versatilis Ellin345]